MAQPSSVLLSFVGSRDPFVPTEKGRRPGPILTLLGERSFDFLYLLFNLGAPWNDRAAQTLNACQATGRVQKVEYQPTELLDVTDHAELFRVMNHTCQGILRSHQDPNTHFFIATASGTPAMQTVWVLLTQSGLFPATLLVTTPPQFARLGEPLVREVDLELDDFPHIQSPEEAKRQLSILGHQIETLKTRNAALEAQSGSSCALALPDDGLDLKAALYNQETAFFRLALEKAMGNAAEAARLLKLQPHTFRKRAQALGILCRKTHKK